MPTTIPNFLNNSQSPLGKAFANLSSQIAAQPSDADAQKSADDAVMAHWKMLGLQGMGTQLANGFPAGTAPSVGTGGPNVSPVVASTPSDAATFQNPASQSALGAQMQSLAPQSVPVPQARPEPGQQMPAAAPMAEVQSPVVAAFGKPDAPSSPAPSAKPAIDMGQYTRNALFAGQKPEDAGGYMLLGDANTYGARDPRTTNATVGAGKSYDQTAEHFDIGQSNDLHKADQTDATSRSNNAATQATSRANNAANISKDFGIEGMKEKQAEAGGGTATLDPSTVKYLADQVRMGAPLPALGLGKQAAAMRAQILTQAAADDTAASRTGVDAAVAKADFAGNLAESRNLGTRSGTAGNAVNELAGIIPTTKALIGTVARTGLYPVDTIVNAAQHGTNDPQLAKLAVSINDAVTAHARAINPQGLVTDAGRSQGFALLNQVQSPDAMGAALDQMMVGAQRALHAPGQTRQQMHDSMHGALGTAPVAPAAAETWVRGPNGQLQKAP